MNKACLEKNGGRVRVNITLETEIRDMKRLEVMLNKTLSAASVQEFQVSQMSEEEMLREYDLQTSAVTMFITQ